MIFWGQVWPFSNGQMKNWVFGHLNLLFCGKILAIFRSPEEKMGCWTTQNGALWLNFGHFQTFIPKKGPQTSQMYFEAKIGPFSYML